MVSKSEPVKTPFSGSPTFAPSLTLEIVVCAAAGLGHEASKRTRTMRKRMRPPATELVDAPDRGLFRSARKLKLARGKLTWDLRWKSKVGVRLASILIVAPKLKDFGQTICARRNDCKLFLREQGDKRADPFHH